MIHEDNSAPPWADPIVSQARKVREALFASADYDLEKLSRRLRQEQSESGRQVVTRSLRRPGRRNGEAA